MASTTARSFNYSSQEINLIAADGTTPITIPIKSIDEWNLFNVMASISFGVQAGTLCIMFITTAVLTRSTKLRMPIHILNLLSLFFGFFRSVFQASYYTSNWSRFQARFLHDYSDVSFRNYFVSILSIITPLLFATTVTISLAFQAHTVTKILNKKWHNLISFLSILIFLLAVGFRFTNTVYNCKAVVQTKPYFNYEWLQLSVLITETMTIWFYSLIFTGKLVFHMWRWRYSNKRMYLQIPVIMGTCTMIIPSIFALIHFIDIPTIPSIDTWPLAVVALLLPMSTLWTTMEPNPTFDILKAWGNHSSEELFINGCRESSTCRNFSQNLKPGPGRNQTTIFNPQKTNSIDYVKTQATTNSSFSQDSLKGYLWKTDDQLDLMNDNHIEKKLTTQQTTTYIDTNYLTSMADLRKIGLEGFALIDKIYGPQHRRSTANDAFPGRRERCWVVCPMPNDQMEELNSKEAAVHYGVSVVSYPKGKPQNRWGRPIKP